MPATPPPTTTPYDYPRFSQLSGSILSRPQPGYRVQYKSVLRGRNVCTALVLIAANLAFQISFLIWLFLPSHINFTYLSGPAKAGVIFILCGIAVIEGLRLFNVASLCLSTLLAKDPRPVQPEPGMRVAFTTTIVPGKEPWELAEKTLRHALDINYAGPIDVWLLDEGNDPEIKAACQQMGVKHFSRKGFSYWNTISGTFKARTKHGNHNAWIDAHGDNYDYVLSVDTDHVPHANFAERFLGYFQDPDVAFVVGPQVYGNFNNPVTKGAESQAYPFQATIQRGGNAYRSAMFVGTNHAYRVSAWKAVGGFQDSITEDMLTGMALHANRNPETGNNWRSVYTPDVVAVGEGPSSWTDFFSQQLRWSRGANEVLVTRFFPILRRLPLASKLHYISLIFFYPSVAISWIFGMFASMVYLLLGQTGLQITGDIWLALYVDATIAQILLYGWLRRFNVSPHEKAGTIGAAGMFFSMIAAPIYVTAFISTLLRRSPKFVVTAKGDSTSADRLLTFRKHLMWSSLIVVFFAYSLLSGHAYPVIIVWSVVNLLLCLSPLLVWQSGHLKQARQRLLHIFTSRHLAEVKEVI